MTPERLNEIRKTYYDPEDRDAVLNNAEELLDEVDRLREKCCKITEAATQALFEMREAVPHLTVHQDSYFDAINALKKLLEAR